MSRRPILSALSLITALVAVGACTEPPKAESPKAGSPTAEPQQSEPQQSESQNAEQAPGQTRRVDVEGDILAMTVQPLVRSGTTVVLTVQTTNTRKDDPIVPVLSFSKNTANRFDGGRLIDESGGRVWATATRPGDAVTCVCTGLVRIEPGETRPLQAAFAGVPADVTKLSVMLPWAGVFTDVPVVAGPVPAPPAGEDKTGTVQAPLDMTAVGTSVTGALQSYSERLDVAMTTRSTPAKADISLDADVLFKLDKADLTPAAAKSLAAAAGDVEGAGPGALTITGHTDNSGSPAHNQDLSRRRAEAVAVALRDRLPDARWPRTVVGKGETQPVVPNTSAGNRRLNRRVEISYKPASNASAAPSPSAPAKLPDTTGVRGEGAAGVTVALPRGHGTVRLIPKTVTARGANLLVELVARNTGTGDADLDRFLGSGLYSARGAFDPQASFGTAGVRLLAGTTAYYQLDYPVEGEYRCLCDNSLARRIPAGHERVLPLWFPRPPGTSGTITIDVPGNFRMTGVPIQP